VQQQVLGVGQAAQGRPHPALGHELLELHRLQVIPQSAHRLPGLVQRRDDRRRDRARAGASDPLKPVPGLFEGKDGAGQADALYPAAFQDEIGRFSGALRGRGRSMIGHRSLDSL
jgi:hypothetical protein